MSVSNGRRWSTRVHETEIYFDFAEANEIEARIANLEAGSCRTIRARRVDAKRERERASQAEKGVGWMPRGQVPRKGAESGETWLGSCKRAMIQSNPNGATQLVATPAIRR